MTKPLQSGTKILYSRQIAFIAAFLLPMAKFLETPSLLAKYASDDLLLPVLAHFLLQGSLIALFLYVASKSKRTLLERVQGVLGKGIVLVYAFFATYYLFYSILPLLDLEKYVYASFFDTAPTVFAFAAFFILSAFICTKGFRAIGRSADLCLFLFVLPFFALIFMSLWETDFSQLLPFFNTPIPSTRKAFAYSSPHFSDALLLLPLIAIKPYEQGDAKKILTGYAVGATFVLIFLAVFFGIFASISPREHYAFSKIAQYFPPLTVIGRIDLIFVYLLSVVLFFYTCLPLQYTTQLYAKTFSLRSKPLVSTLLNLGLFLFTLFCNKYYNGFYNAIAKTLYPIFWLVNLSTLLLLLLPKFESKQTAKKEKSYEPNA